MQLYPAGKIAEQLWLEIPSHFPFVRLDSFVVMPNHIHGILIIDKEDQVLASLQNKTPGQQRFRNPESSSISSILGSYKSEVTKRVRKSNELFGWQSRFHDRVIRDDAEYRRIVHYIENNVSNWVDDSYFSI
jgi:REP element-mobilizing transposase RayT